MKNRLYKFFLCWLVFGVLFTTPVIWANEPIELTIGVYHNPPKVFLNKNNKAEGFFIDLLKEIAKHENWKLGFKQKSWPELLEALKTAEIDLLPDVAYSQKRSEIYDLNKETVISDWFQVFTGVKRKFNTILDLKDVKIAVLDGSIQLDYLLNLQKNLDQNIILVKVDDYKQLFETVKNKKTDLLLSNRFAGKLLAPAYGIKETSLIFNPTSLHIATTKHKNAKILKIIDDYLKEWKKDKNSFYYKSLSRQLNGDKNYHLPEGLILAIKVLVGLLIIGGLTIALFKHRLKKRTLELKQSNLKLIQTLKELEAAHKKAITQEKLNALGQMASGIAHDFNNVLMPICGFSDLILSSDDILKDHNTVKQYLKTIRDAGEDGQELVKRMRSFYRHTDKITEKNSEDINELISKIKDLTAPKWKEQPQQKGIKVDFDFMPGDIPKVEVYKMQIREMLVNLIFNAVDAMPEGGKISIKTYHEGGLVHILISDTGQGMNQQTQQQCFKAFYSTKGEKGTGMGLSMVKEICENHAALLEVSSALNEGTTFKISLPVSHQEKENEFNSEKQFDKKLDILVVDDDKRSLEVVCAILKQNGHKVTSCLSPQNALEKARNNNFDLLISDYSMPEISGAKLINLVRSNKPLQKAFILSGSYYEDINSELNRLNVILIEKPLDQKKLNNALNTIFS
jgi:signal transduction histidine kinase/ABC-type amino acid transport substrate-binding protein